MLYVMSMSRVTTWLKKTVVGAPGLFEILDVDSVLPGSSTPSEMAPHLSSEDRGFYLAFQGPRHILGRF